MNSKKTVTFIISTNQRGGTRRLVVASAWIKTVLALAVIGGIIFSAVFIDYVGLLVQSNENKRLHAENARLNSQFELVEGKLQSLESGLERLKRFSTKLKVITDAYGVQDRELHLAMGPLVKTGESLEALQQPVENREPLDNLEKKDAVFFD